MPDSPFQHISDSPTLPKSKSERDVYDVSSLYEGPITTASEVSGDIELDEKLRQAYFWIVNFAIISPHYDLEYHDGPSTQLRIGDGKTAISLPSGQSYSSFVLMPLLTFAVRKRCLFIGGPGRGKTASAILMGLLAGYSLKDVRRSIQHGQPQMTISDLLGNPLPSDLINAKNMDDIQIAWRKWLSMRVKIIDEYNRIPTRTQSALLTVLADNYAEIMDQIYECPDAAWFLTANDDAGGGTYPVIEALRDRIDVVVKALAFNHRFLDTLLTRIEEDIRPEEVMPSRIIFTESELDQMNHAIRGVKVPPLLRRRLEFFASQFEYLDFGGEQLEYKTKDTARIAGLDVSQLSAKASGVDRLKDLGSQTMNGLSVRALLTTLSYVKALAYFRGNNEVEIDDLRQILPFVLHDRLVMNADSPFFETAENERLRSDRVSWIRRLFDLACAEYDRLDLDQSDPVADYSKTFELGLEGLTASVVETRLVQIENTLRDWTKGRKLYGHLYEDILKLKYLHQRYTNYLRWLKWQS